MRPRPASARLAAKIRTTSDRTFFVVEAFNRARRTAAVGAARRSGRAASAVHDKHNLASPSPVTDGQMVYAWFGTGQIVALDMTGKVVWERHLGKEISPFDINWGHSSSPTLFQDSLILLCDHAPASCCSRSTRARARIAGRRIAAAVGRRIPRRSWFRPHRVRN